MHNTDGIRSARVMQVIETKSTRGNGTTENPVRVITQYWDLDGDLLADDDEFINGQSHSNEHEE